MPYHLSGLRVTPQLYLSTLRQGRAALSGKPGADILEISPHRVYLISLQHYLYILSVALVLIAMRPTGVTRYAALRCPDFPPFL